MTIGTTDTRLCRGISECTYVTVEQCVGELVQGTVRANSIESTCVLLKHGYVGIYRYLSEKRMCRCMDELATRCKSCLDTY